MKKLLMGLIGSGIQRSLTPRMHEEEATHHGLRLHYLDWGGDAARTAQTNSMPERHSIARPIYSPGYGYRPTAARNPGLPEL